jgi:TetR/AcrR family transcriptional regulator of autoinduction and epiphytic fitness
MSDKTVKANKEPKRRKTGTERVTEILDVATEVFMTDGFAAASTNEIAKRANASKETFYARFPSKQQLFIAVMERRMAIVSAPLQAALPQEPDTRATLMSFGANLLQEILSREQVTLIRIIGMESERFPELGHKFYELAPKKGQAVMAQYLEGQIALGRLRSVDPMRMAEHLQSLLMGGEVRWSALGLTPKPIGPKQLKEHLHDAIDAFLHAYAISVAPRV